MENQLWLKALLEDSSTPPQRGLSPAQVALTVAPISDSSQPKGRRISARVDMGRSLLGVGSCFVTCKHTALKNRRFWLKRDDYQAIAKNYRRKVTNRFDKQKSFDYNTGMPWSCGS